MLPKRIEIKNFLAYRSPEPLRFDGIHLACLTGANGAGKSSLLDAITWALWGKARAGMDDLVHQGQGEMYVQLDFEQEGVIYQVVRRRSRPSRAGGSGSTQLDLFSIDAEGMRVSLNGSSVRATQEVINRIIRLDYETFIHSAFLQQGKADSFTTKPPRERKQILADILGLARWEQYEAAVKEVSKNLDEQIAAARLQITSYEQELEKEETLKAQLEQAEALQVAAKKALEEAEARLKEVAHADRDLRAAQQRKAELEQRLRERDRDLAAARQEIERHEARIRQYESILAQADSIEAGYAALQAARDADHALGDKLRALNELDQRIYEAQRQLDRMRSDLEAEIREYAVKIEGLRATIAAARTEDHAALQAEISALNELEEKYYAALTAEREENERYAFCKSENNRLKSEMDALKVRIDQVEALEGACPLCGQPLDNDHRAQLLEELQTEGKSKGDQYRANQAQMKEIEAQRSARAAELKTLEVDLKRLAKLREEAAALSAAISAANLAQMELGEAEAQYNTLRAALDGQQFGADLRARLEALTAERAALGYDKSQHDEARRELATYQEYEARHRDLDAAKRGLPDAQEALQNVEARAALLAESREKETAELAQTMEDITALETLVKEQRAREQEVAQQRALERKANDELVTARQELLALEAIRQRKAEYEKRLTADLEERALYDELRVAFGKNGIPAMIIETVIPELEQEANRLLGRMTDGRMNLRLITQRDKATGGVAETLDIQVEDELGVRAYDLFSGGEAFRINFALRVALSQLLARRAGAHLRTLFLDEGFGTQDDDGRNKLVEAITVVQDEFDLILVITHIEDLRDRFPVHILVEKLAEGSRLSVK